jgi:DNA ligase D-like protein (predicted 3'-phosphoesterase)
MVASSSSGGPSGSPSAAAPHLTPEQLNALFGCGRLFVVQRHDAQIAGLHFDLRIEHNGVLKSWAIKKGFTNDPATMRLAVETPDHAKGYGKFEGAIPAGYYGAGSVQIFDIGWFEIVDKDAEDRRRNDSDTEDEEDGHARRNEGLKGQLDLGGDPRWASSYPRCLQSSSPLTSFGHFVLILVLRTCSSDYIKTRHTRVLNQQLEKKKLSIIFHGQRLKGRFSLFRFEAPPNWRKSGSYG